MWRIVPPIVIESRQSHLERGIILIEVIEEILIERAQAVETVSIVIEYVVA
jgi:hypothetical protein